jgi:radical SAM superfamily enzyme YgiQ (UPF0313 family)
MVEFKPELVCFSCMSVEANEMRRLAGISKEVFPHVPVWIGGPHASVFYDKELATGDVDAACIGEGEHTFFEMIQAWLNSDPLDGISGLALMRDGQVTVTGPRAPIEDLDSIPLPAWDMIDFKYYGKKRSMNGFAHSVPWALLFTTRGCPYQCVYCHKIFGKAIRKRSVEHVMNELGQLVHQYGVREIHIADDIFNLDLPRAKAICDNIVARGLNIKIAFPNGLRGDRMDRQLIRKLKAAGCYSISYAIETASPRLQKKIKKNLDLEKVREAIAWTDEEGIIPTGFVMLGFPGETIEEIKASVDYALNSRLVQCFFFTVVVYPRTGLYNLAKEAFPFFELDDSDFLKFNYWSEEPYYSIATGVDLKKIQRNAYRVFYLRPFIIIEIIKRFPKNKRLFSGIHAGLLAVLPRLSTVEKYFAHVRRWLYQRLMLKKKQRHFS